jgi:hypothetical protein
MKEKGHIARAEELHTNEGLKRKGIKRGAGGFVGSQYQLRNYANDYMIAVDSRRLVERSQ